MYSVTDRIVQTSEATVTPRSKRNTTEEPKQLLSKNKTYQTSTHRLLPGSHGVLGVVRISRGGEQRAQPSEQVVEAHTFAISNDDDRTRQIVGK